MTNLEKYLYQLRRIEQHREAAAEKEIRKTYKKLLKELNSYLANIYLSYSEDDMLTYSDLARAGIEARFLEEVEQQINGITPQVASQINETVKQTYEACYDGMRNAVVKAAGNREALQQAFATVSAVTPDVIKRAVENPVSGLTLKDTLEKHRKEIIYDIKRNIGVGLTNGDRYTTMAKRISESLDGDYKKSIRIVRTEAHRVRESGLNDAATEINAALKNGKSGYVMAKTWHTMNDAKVRPNTVYKTKKGWKRGKKSKYNHEKMDGVTIPQDEDFKLPSGATCKCPSQTGVAGEDINCRCVVSYDLVLASELTKVQDGLKTIEEIVKVEKPTFRDFADGNEATEFFGKRPDRALRKSNREEYDRKREEYENSSFGYWHNNLTTEQESAIRDYSADDYSGINGLLRHYMTEKMVNTWNEVSSTTLQDKIENITRAIAQFELKEPIKVYRTCEMDVFQSLKKEVGSIFSDNAFTSTSVIKEKVASGNVRMAINVPAGKGYGAWINPLSGAEDEEWEFLLQRGTRFRVDGIETKDGEILINMSVLDNEQHGYSYATKEEVIEHWKAIGAYDEDAATKI